MDLLQIPFVRHVGLERGQEGRLQLTYRPEVQNHLQTLHAAAQFALAETASGEALLQGFPDLAGQVIPMLREARIKYKRPASSDIQAVTEITPEAAASFQRQFSSKGRATISVAVSLQDGEGTLLAQGTFDWFVARQPA